MLFRTHRNAAVVPRVDSDALGLFGYAMRYIEIVQCIAKSSFPTDRISRVV